MIAKRIPEGGFLPTFYAPTYKDWDTEQYVCYPIPIHVVVRVYRDFVYWAREWWRPSYQEKHEMAAYWKGHSRGYDAGYRRGGDDLRAQILADVDAKYGTKPD